MPAYGRIPEQRFGSRSCQMVELSNVAFPPIVQLCVLLVYFVKGKLIGKGCGELTQSHETKPPSHCVADSAPLLTQRLKAKWMPAANRLFEKATR
jgi:hypothetical protein